MFRIVTDNEFPALWVVVMDDADRGEVKVSGPTSCVFEAIHVILPRVQARFDSI